MPTHRGRHIPQTALSRHAYQSLREELAPFPPRQNYFLKSPSLLKFLKQPTHSRHIKTQTQF